MADAIPARRSPRWQGYDYRHAGAYFITICTYDRQHHFGEVLDETVRLTMAGTIAAADWQAIPARLPGVDLDLFVVMPNHMHGILLLPDTHTLTIAQIVGLYKSGVSRQVNQHMRLGNTPLWQRSFHDHVIRNERELNMIRQYVETNPAGWHKDTFYTAPS